MPKAEIEEFAKILVREVRDRAIAGCDALLQSGSNNAIAKRWREKLDGKSVDLGSTMIPDCVDHTLFYLLHAIDEGVLRLSFVSSNGRKVDLATEGEGELAGWYAGVDPWITQYSEQRFVDYFEDLTGLKKEA